MTIVAILACFGIQYRVAVQTGMAIERLSEGDNDERGTERQLGGDRGAAGAAPGLSARASLRGPGRKWNRPLAAAREPQTDPHRAHREDATRAGFRDGGAPCRRSCRTFTPFSPRLKRATSDPSSSVGWR